MACFDLPEQNGYNCPLMSGELPERVEPLLLAEQDTVMEGSMALACMKRLCEVAPANGSLQARLHFFADEVGRPFLSGSFSTDLELVCQRCMEVMRVPLSGDFRLSLVTDLEQADRRDDSMDVLEVGPRAMSLATILEDEVLLLVPASPMHPREQCNATGMPEHDTVDEQQPPLRPNPFAALAALKQNRDRDDR
jgi:uncharacterized protein